MKNSSKKIRILILVICCVIVFTSFFGSGLFGKVDKILVSAIKMNALNIVVEDSPSISKLLKLIDSSKKVKPNSEIDTLTPILTLNFSDSSNKEYQYNICTSSDTRFYYIYDSNEPNQEIYWINRDEVNSLLTQSEFDAIYNNKKPKPLDITINGAQYTLESSSYNWNYKKINNQLYNNLYTNQTPNIQTFSLTSLQNIFIPNLSANDKIIYTIYKENKVLYEGDTLSEYHPKESGVILIKVTITSNDTDGSSCFGTSDYLFQVNYTCEPSISISKTDPILGEMIVVYANMFPEGESLTISTDLNYKPQFYSINANTQVAVIPISYNSKLGKHKINITGTNYQKQIDFNVLDRTFDIQRLTVDEKTTSQTVNNPAANDEYAEKFERLKQVIDPTLYASGKFLKPVEGEVTTEFGMMRFVNNSKTPSRHAGIDLAAKKGTPVKATNSGRVLFAGFLQLTGNTVLIEHGLGIKSFYYHMDSLNVKENDMVTIGDTVGLVGSTGFSTGPHLHFALSINTTYINPWKALEGELITIE